MGFRISNHQLASLWLTSDRKVLKLQFHEPFLSLCNILPISTCKLEVSTNSIKSSLKEMAKSFREALKIKGRNAIYGNGFEINYHAKNWIKVDFDLLLCLVKETIYSKIMPPL